MEIIRFKFSRGPELRFLSHLDQQRLFQRAFRRADIPMSFSEGFNPHPRLAFAQALPLGSTSDAEYGDIGLTKATDPDIFIEKLNTSLPMGIKILEATTIPQGTPSLTSSLKDAVYSIKIPFNNEDVEEIMAAINSFLQKDELIIQKRTKRKKMRPVNIRPFIRDISLNGRVDEFWQFELSLIYIEQQCVKPILVFQTLSELKNLNMQINETILIHKKEQNF